VREKTETRDAQANLADLRRDLIEISDYTVRRPRLPASRSLGIADLAGLAQYLKSVTIAGKAFVRWISSRHLRKPGLSTGHRPTGKY